MSKLSEIKAQIAQLQRDAEEIFKLEKQAAIADITSKLFAYNISIEEIAEKKRGFKATPNTPTSIKYRKSEHEYWGGRGPKPKWVKDVEARGERIDLYRVQEQITQ
ncbi:MAG: H-NS histone family protein [Chlorobiaceae bacterium]